MIGQKLKSLREYKKISQSEVAKIIGIDNTSLSKYETNKNVPDIYTLHALSTFFGVPISHFLSTPDTEQIELISILENQVLFDGQLLTDDDKWKLIRILHILFEDKK